MANELIASLLLNALNTSLLLALLALGLVVIYGLMGIINLAHGSFLMLGAYTVWLSATELGIGFWPGFIIAPILVGVVGMVAERVVIRYFYDRLLDSILATWGLAIILRELVKIIVGDTSKQVGNPIPARVDLGVTTYPAYRIFLIGLSVVILVGVFLVVSRTDIGVRLRAVIQDPEAASILGLNQTRTYQFTFAFGAGIAGLAGAAIAPVVAVEPTMGLSYLVQSFLAVILGGTGVLVGVIPGSLVVGGLANFASYLFEPVIGQTIVYVLVVTAILFRPQGILGEFHE